jgi:hypothetical protein
MAEEQGVTNIYTPSDKMKSGFTLVSLITPKKDQPISMK